MSVVQLKYKNQIYDQKFNKNISEMLGPEMGTIGLWENDWPTVYDTIGAYVLEKFNVTTSIIKFL